MDDCRDRELFARLPIWILRDRVPAMSPAEVKLLCIYHRFADFSGRTCNPTQRRIRNLYGLSFTTIKNLSKSLRRQGLIRQTQYSRRQAPLTELAEYPEQAEVWAAEFAASHPEPCPPPEQPILPFMEEVIATPAGAFLHPKNQSPQFLQEIASAPAGGALSAPAAGAPLYNHKRRSINIYKEQDHETDYRKASRLLVQIGIRGSAIRELLQRHDPAELLTACHNAIARWAWMRHNQRPGAERFNLSGYVVNSLKRAGMTGKRVEISELRKNLESGSGCPLSQDQLVRYQLEMFKCSK